MRISAPQSRANRFFVEKFLSSGIEIGYPEGKNQILLKQ